MVEYCQTKTPTLIIVECCQCTKTLAKYNILKAFEIIQKHNGYVVRHPILLHIKLWKKYLLCNHGVGMVPRLVLTAPREITCYKVKEDG